MGWKKTNYKFTSSEQYAQEISIHPPTFVGCPCAEREMMTFIKSAIEEMMLPALVLRCVRPRPGPAPRVDLSEGTQP